MSRRIKFVHCGKILIKAIAFICLSFVLLFGLMWAVNHKGIGDFGSFVETGRSAAKGNNPYGAGSLTYVVQWRDYEFINYNLNPPISVLFFQAINSINPEIAYITWNKLSFGIYLVSLALLFFRYRPHPMILFWALCIPAFWDTIRLGQIYTPLLLAIVLSWLFLEDDRPILAGVFLGFLIAWKPNFLVWPFLLLIEKRYKAVISTALSYSLLFILPLFFYGPDIYIQWFELLKTDTSRVIFPTNASLLGFSTKAGFPTLGYLVAGFLILFSIISIYRQIRKQSEVSSDALLLSLLASPIAWVQYTMFLLPIFFANRWNKFHFIAACLIAVPIQIFFVFTNGSSGELLTAGSAYNWGLIFLYLASQYQPDANIFHLNKRGLKALVPAKSDEVN